MNEVSPELLRIMRNGDNSIEYKCKKIISLIRNFQSELNENTELSIKFASYSENIEMSPQFIAWQEPDFIVFKGTISDQPATIIQNANQINFLLCGVPKALPQEPARRAKIGFDLEV